MTTPVIHVEDTIAMFSADDSARDAIPEDSALRGMQLALLQEAAPPALLAEVSKRFQRSWFEAAVVERAADHRCGWPACGAIMQVAKGRAQLLAKLVRYTLEVLSGRHPLAGKLCPGALYPCKSPRRSSFSFVHFQFHFIYLSVLVRLSWAAERR